MPEFLLPATVESWTFFGSRIEPVPSWSWPSKSGINFTRLWTMFWKADWMLPGWWKTRSAPHSCRGVYLRCPRLFRWITTHRTTLRLWKYSPRTGSVSCSRLLTRSINSVCPSMSPRYPPTSTRPPIFSTLPTKMGRRFRSRFDSKRFAYPFTKV